MKIIESQLNQLITKPADFVSLWIIFVTKETIYNYIFKLKRNNNYLS